MERKKRRVASLTGNRQAWQDGVKERVRSETEGVDLVAMALENPREVIDNVTRRCVLLGRAPSMLDEKPMLMKITDNQCRRVGNLMSNGAYPGTYGAFFTTMDCWKLIACDGRVVEDSAHLQREYQAQLLAEEQQTPLERAREAVRTDEEKLACRNAKLMIAALEELAPEERRRLEQERNELENLWARVSPRAPSWITDIRRSGLPWGYVFYKTTQVDELIGDEWDEAQERLEELDNVFFAKGKSIAASAGLGSIHCPGEEFVWKEDWVDQTFDDEDLMGPRK
jgi:hypothetical protein